MSLISTDQQTAESLFANEYTMQDGKYYIDLNLIDSDDDGIQETISGENVIERNNLFSGKFLSLSNMIDKINGNILTLPFEEGLKASFHIKNNIQFVILHRPGNIQLTTQLHPILNETEFESLINYDFNYFNSKIQDLIVNGKTDGLSLREEYLRSDNENGFFSEEYDNKNCYIGFKYHLKNKMETELYYKNLSTELSINFLPIRFTFRPTDKFRIIINKNYEIITTQISEINLQTPENQQFLISEILRYYDQNSQSQLLDYLLTEYQIIYLSPQNLKTDPTVTDPTVTDPTVTDTTKTDPTITDPTVTDTTKTDPTITDPTVTDTTKTDPTITDPTVTDPTVTDTTKNVIVDSDTSVTAFDNTTNSRRIFNITPYISYITGDLPNMKLPNELEGVNQLVFEDTNGDGIYENLILEANLNDLSGGVIAPPVDYTNSNFIKNPNQYNNVTVELPNKITYDYGNGNTYASRHYFIDDFVLEIRLNTDGNPLNALLKASGLLSMRSPWDNFTLPNGNTITDEFIYDKFIEYYPYLDKQYVNTTRSFYYDINNPNNIIELNDIGKKRVSKIVKSDLIDNRFFNLITQHGTYYPVTLQDTDDDGIYDTILQSTSYSNGMGGNVTNYPCALVGKYDKISGIQVVSPNKLETSDSILFLTATKQSQISDNKVNALKYDKSTKEYSYINVDVSRFIDQPTSQVQSNTGTGVTEWDGVVPPPTSGNTQSNSGAQIGDWSGSGYSGPSGPITSDTTNNNQQTSNTEISGVLFRLHAGNRHKFFPYSTNNNEQPWTHTGGKVNITATPKAKAWYVCWNIGIRSDGGTQLKMRNIRNPKESEEPVLSFPKPKSLSSVNDITPYYVEQFENQQKWSVYLPGYSLPIFTIEPSQGCNVTYMTNSGWFHNESSTAEGVSNSGLILTRLSGVETANDIELYVGCAAKNEDGTSLEIVYTRIILKANSVNSPDISMKWMPA